MWDSVTIRDWQSSIWDLNNKLNVMAGGKGPVVDAGDFTHEVEWDTIPASFPLSINPPVAKQTWVLKFQGLGVAKVSLCRQTPMVQ